MSARSYWERNWEERGENTRRYKGEEFYTISSPFYNCMMWFYNLARYMLPMLDNKTELIYSELAVMITKHLDKVWQWERFGLLHCTFVKGT